MVINKIYRGQILRVAVGITLFAMLLLGSAGAKTTVNSCTDISSPGEYTLDRSIMNSTSLGCININSSNVIFDGAGFTLGGVNNSGIIGINVINPSAELTNVTVKNLNITGWYTGIAYRGESNGNITGNTVLNNNFGIVLVNSSSNNMLNSNRISNNSVGILLGNSSSNNTLSGNKISNNSVIGTYVGSSLNTLSGNNASNNLNGILLNSSSGNTLSGNDILNNLNGISLINSSNNTLSGTTASKNFGGIYMESSFLNKLSCNTVSNNLDGIILNSSSNNALNGNNVSDNFAGIILFSFSSNNTVSNNTVSKNLDGISLINSSDNTIYNNFLNNTNNSLVGDTVYNNTWNITRTNGMNIAGGPHLGGNLWANPNGTGFSQMCADTDKDGICDSPYILNDGNVDYLPLVGRP